MSKVTTVDNSYGDIETLPQLEITGLPHLAGDETEKIASVSFGLNIYCKLLMFLS